jgi:hypothetical protein
MPRRPKLGTIQAMGHTSFKTAERFYKRAVTKDEATAFFDIMPAAEIQRLEVVA